MSFTYGNHLSPFRIGDGPDSGDYFLLHSPPREGPPVFLIFQFHEFAAATHQGIGHSLVYYGKIELVGLYGTSTLGALEPCLDEPSFVRFPYPSLVHYLIEFTGFNALAKNKIKLEKYDKCNDGYAFCVNF